MPHHIAGPVREIIYAHFDPGEDLLEGIKAVAREREISAGVVLSITGGLVQARLSSFPEPGPIETTAIDYYTIPGPLEASGHGVIGVNRSEGSPYVHVHLIVATRQETVMGHLEPGTIVRALISRSKFTIALAAIDEVTFELHEDAEASRKQEPFQNWRDSRGWPAEPLYHVLSARRSAAD